jgi:hypothetical protein
MSEENLVNIVCGLPDDAGVRLRQIIPTLDFVHSGTASFLIQTKVDRRWRPIWVGPSAPASSPVGPGPMINYIADPDLCSQSLAVASKVASTLHRPWFNHPDRIKDTTRDKVSVALQGITGVDTPRVVRSRPQVLRDILGDIDRHGLNYPVLIRAAGQHGGKTLVRLDGPSPDQIFDSQLAYGPDLYITEYRNFADTDGIFRRYRFAVVGGEPFIKSVLAGRRWNLHAEDRIWTPPIIAEERQIIDTFNAVLKPKIQDRITEIYRRLGLDYFGIDCALRPNGDLVIFEANATMNILVDIKLQPDLWSEATTQIKTALLNLIDNPSKWVSGGASTVNAPPEARQLA